MSLHEPGQVDQACRIHVRESVDCKTHGCPRTVCPILGNRPTIYAADIELIERGGYAVEAGGQDYNLSHGQYCLLRDARW